MSGGNFFRLQASKILKYPRQNHYQIQTDVVRDSSRQNGVGFLGCLFHPMEERLRNKGRLEQLQEKPGIPAQQKIGSFLVYFASTFNMSLSFPGAHKSHS